MEIKKNISDFNLPSHIVLDPFGFKKGTALEPIIIDFSSDYNSSEWKIILKHIIDRALMSKNNISYLVFENHTKALNEKKFENIIFILEFLFKNYKEFISFKTISQIERDFSYLFND